MWILFHLFYFYISPFTIYIKKQIYIALNYVEHNIFFPLILFILIWGIIQQKEETETRKHNLVVLMLSCKIEKLWSIIVSTLHFCLQLEIGKCGQMMAADCAFLIENIYWLLRYAKFSA